MTTVTPTYDPTLFQGAAWYYARYRSKYPTALFNLLSDLFQLNGTERLLDLGCGAGLIAVPFHDHFSEVVAVDPDAEMLQAAEEEAKAVHANNIRWVHDRAESLTADWGPFRLVTMGRSFHWMQRELVLEKIHSALSEHGGVAIIKNSDDPWHSDYIWKQTAIEVVKRWLGDQRRTGQSGQGVWQPLDVPHDVILEHSSFSRQETFQVTFEKTWTVDEYLGYLYSTAFCLPSFVGDNREPFEADLRSSLLAVEPSGQFQEQLTTTALVGWK